MMILKTLALVILFFVDLSFIEDEPCIPCVAGFCEDYIIIYRIVDTCA